MRLPGSPLMRVTLRRNGPGKMGMRYAGLGASAAVNTAHGSTTGTTFKRDSSDGVAPSTRPESAPDCPGDEECLPLQTPPPESRNASPAVGMNAHAYRPATHLILKPPK